MQDDPTTPNEGEHPDLDAEDWEIALVAYKGNPGAALMLGFHLMVLQSYLAVEPLKIKEAIAAIELACEVLFPYTEFHQIPWAFFRRAIQGQLTIEEEEQLRALGIKF